MLGNRIVWGNPRERDLAPSLLPRFFQTIYTLSSVLLSTSSISPDPSSHPPPAVVMGLPSRLEGPCHVRPELRPCSAGKWGGGPLRSPCPPFPVFLFSFLSLEVWLVTSDLWTNVSFLASWWRRQAPGAVRGKASLETPLLCGARTELCRALAKPQGLATHLHVSFCLLEDTDHQCTPWVGPRLCWPPLRAVLPLLSQSVCALSPNRPQPRPLWLQEPALPCNVLILIKVQTGFFFLEVEGGAQVWDEKGTALPHPYCMPAPIPTFPTNN